MKSSTVRCLSGNFAARGTRALPGGVIGASKMPEEINPPGILFWRRPTLARPFVALPSGLQRFTAVFGMGTGGATALMSPDDYAGCRRNRLVAARSSRRVNGDR